MPSYQQAAQSLSGVRFTVTYSFFGPEEEAHNSARATCVEQTIEFPPYLLPENDYWGMVQGQVEEFRPVADEHFLVKISYAVETVSPDILQVLNVIYGNISMIPGIRVEDVDLPPEVLAIFSGPRFGLDGVRELCGVPDRSMICATIKPMGLSMQSFAEIAFEVALGGADMVKDDHGLTDQAFARFEKRVSVCAEAVQRANAETGGNCLYAPNVTAPTDQISHRAHFAKQAGAQALMVIPGLVGWDVVRMLREDAGLGLPIVCHPSYFGVYYINPRGGFSARFAYGILPRLAGGDISIMPNYKGRLYSTKQDCLDVIAAAKREMGHLKTLLPAPGGGITLETIPELVKVYGRDVIYIMGGGLHAGNAPLANTQKFRELVAAVPH